jgi:hypothetical protein
MSGKEKREKMAIMETAISASLSHPNIVQVGGVHINWTTILLHLYTHLDPAVTK